MKRIIITISMFLGLILITQGQGLILSNEMQLSVQQYPDGSYLTLNGIKFFGTRGQVLDLENVNLAQPLDKNLMILLDETPSVPLGATVCFPLKRSLLFIRKNGYWLLLRSGLQGNVDARFSSSSPFEVVVFENPDNSWELKEQRITYIKL